MNSAESKRKPRSKIFSALSGLSAKIRAAFSESLTCRIITGKPKGSSQRSLSTELVEKAAFKKRASIPVKRFMARHTEQSIVLFGINKFMKRLRDLYLKNIGTALFSFGAYVSVASLISHFSSGSTEPILSCGVAGGIALTVVGALLAASPKTASGAICDSRILSFVIFDVLGIKKEKLISKERPIGRSDVSVIIGLIMGLISELSSPSAVIITILLTVLAYAVLCQPECGVITIILAFPFVSSKALVIISGFVCLSWLLKLARGKRTFSIMLSDTMFLVFSLVVLLGGIITSSPETSMKTALQMVLVMTVYLTASNLINTKKWLDRSIRCLIFSLSMVVFINLLSEIANHYAIGEIAVISSVLPSASVSAIITLLLPLLLSYAVTTDTGDKRTGLCLIAFLAIFCSYLCGTKSGAVIALLTVLLFFFLIDRRAFSVLVLLLLFLPAVAVVLPDTAGIAFKDFFTISEESLSYRQEISNAAYELFGISSLGGVGIGSSAMLYSTPTYISGSIIESMSSFSRIIGMLGVTGLFIFAVYVFSFIRRCSAYLYDIKDSSHRHRALTSACLCGVIGCLCLGLFGNVFSSPQSYMLLWLVSGLAISAIKVDGISESKIEPGGLYIDIEISGLKKSEAKNGTK